MKKIFFFTLLVILSFSPSILFSDNSNGGDLHPRVAVSILPLKYLVEKIAKEKASVSVMVPPGANPHSFEPKPKELKSIENASMYVKVGTPLEFELAWMGKLILLNPKMMVCDCSKGVPLLNESLKVMSGAMAIDKRGADPHIWTSLKNAVLMGKDVRDSLVEMDPSNKRFYENNYAQLKKELESLDIRIKEKLKPFRGSSFIVIHSAWNYFSHDYGLNEIAIEVGGKEPPARELEAIIKEAKKEKINVVFVSPEFSKKSAEVIAKEIGARTVSADHLAEDFPAQVEKIAAEITESYGK